MATIEIKVNKRLFVNLLLVIIALIAFLETIELGLISYSIKSGLLCK